LGDAFPLIRQAALRILALAADRQWEVESLPVPLVQFPWVPSSSGDWAA